jgi:plastocyanin
LASLWGALLCLGAGLHATRAADFNVTSPGFSYTINGMAANPTLTLVRGETYTFAVSTALNHPFEIVSPAGTTTSNNISSGTITFRVPTNAANYSYRCSIHFFGGQIVTIPPPTIRIVNFEVGSNLVLKSTGTNN